MCVQVPRRPEEGAKFPLSTGGTGTCKLSGMSVGNKSHAVTVDK